MTWFRVDDGFSEHAKVDALGVDLPMALSVWLLCGSGSARARTDGKITSAALARHCALMRERDRIRGAAALVRVGLWELSDDGDGWRFHQWDDHQPLRADLERAAELGKRRKEAWRERKSAERSATTVERSGNAVPSPSLAQRGTHAPTRPDPTRPDPSLREGGEPPQVTDWLRVLYAEWRAMAGGVPGTGTVERLADAWDSPWKLTRFERETLERAQAVYGVVGTENALRAALGAFAADSFATAKKYPFGLFAKQIAAYASKGAHPAGVSDFSHVPDDQEVF